MKAYQPDAPSRQVMALVAEDRERVGRPHSHQIDDPWEAGLIRSARSRRRTIAMAGGRYLAGLQLSAAMPQIMRSRWAHSRS